MKRNQESISEVYLKKIVEQNDTIIGLLKNIAGNSSKPPGDDDQAIKQKAESLTKRERQIIELIIEGMMNKQMAYELSLSLSTIEAHRSSIMKKFEVKNVAQLTKEYVRYKSLIQF